MPEKESRQVLRALTGPLAGGTFDIGARLVIGRIAACDVHIVDPEVSREHAMLVREGDALLLVDLESSNGTYVGGLRITKRPVELGLAFTISESSFTIEAGRGRPISSKPVFGPSFANTASSERSTLQMQAVDAEPSVSSPERDTRESPRASEDDEDAVDDAPTNRRIEAVQPPAPRRERSTVRLEAAVDPRAAAEKKTAELAAVDAPARSTVELSPPPTTKTPTPSEAVPVFFPPPPNVESEGAALEYTEAKPGFATTSAAIPKSDYDGDLLGDITEYRSFRIRLQRDEIPSGDEVAAMIDLEAKLRGPKADDDPRRDVVALRFFKRFSYEAPVRARFTLPRSTHHLVGTIRDLSVDGLRCALEMGSLTPTRDQFAVLFIESARDGMPVQYTVTSRVVWVKNDEVGFVFAGAPSWNERSGDIEDIPTAVTAAPSDDA